ncbi:DUF305 domain-containing protein [Methylorubrum extorquens]|uniref:DUF305 domain-containing protein n=1 Tax=Methylorubrum extorquens TaxID=408 RepID=A0A1S1P550_METEX|nr:DUF305 domain-containing protein [Methylorubrum extorquens]
MRGIVGAAAVVSLMAVGIQGDGMIGMHAARGMTAAASSFEELMARSSERMHAGMAVKPSGNPDRDFAAMMIPHHQGAVDMAKAELAYGRDPVLRRLAQAIVVEQQQEIEVMQRALAALPPDQTAAGNDIHRHHGAVDDIRSVEVHEETTR